MQNLASIVSFVLGFGSKAEVLEPLELKEALRNELKRMVEINKE